MDKLLNIEELAEMLGVKIATIYKWVSKKMIPHVKLGSKSLRFEESKILDWIERRSVQTDTCSPIQDRKNKRPQVRRPYGVSNKTSNRDIDRIVQQAKKEVLGAF